MTRALCHALAHVDVALTWAARFYAGVVAILVIYLGVAMWMAIRESKPESSCDGDPQASICYQVFRDLVELLYRLFSWRGM